jgi:uroporphyrinogen-III decarboxylase
VEHSIGGSMNNRTRIINTVLFQKTDRPPFHFYFGPWGETIERWKLEGMDESLGWEAPFGFDPGFVHANVNLGYSPSFEHKIMEERADTLIIRDYLGILQEVRKTGSSIPKYIDYPVKTRSDWEQLKAERLDPHDAGRFPADWVSLARQYNEGDRVVQLGCYPYGLFGTLRDMMGVEELLVSFYDQPDLIRDMMDYLTDFWLTIYDTVCREVKVDCIHMWEDMSGCQGSLISPAMVREFMMPNYKKIKTFAEAHHIPIFSLDTDGNCSELLPLFLESGINLVFPFEVAAGSDIVAYRKQYPRLAMMGGIDKREIAKGREYIDRELERIDEIFQDNGYIPALDHLIHPEISWQDFHYFIIRLKQRIGI